ncbi:MAG: TatD family hydrolase [Methylomonas sp.]|jgi:TatD DNase family protein
MFIDSHCHLDRLDLSPYRHSFEEFVQETGRQGVSHMLCIAIDQESFPAMRELTAAYGNISLSAGIHPNVTDGREPDVDDLLNMAAPEKVVAIGETGLDYFHDENDLPRQRQRFKNHIQAAKILNKPLIIHTRDAGQDALEVLRREGADRVGGIIHCFTEDWAFAEKALDLNFYISFSGIVTFKNAVAIKEAAQKIPADRFLIETDSPYLAPAPFRGKPNYPAYVRYVAEQIAELRGISVQETAALSSANFYRLFAGLQAADKKMRPEAAL